MEDYLSAWTSASTRLDDRARALLLHMPVLLGYNARTRTMDDNSVES